ncbi:hypothetical protein [Nitriliruptor alkaliphilus]|uniref:hypothetical protein n=1 Tax=Nitriliruptor alkaliphilus TaxID=427918 RepID=UPI0006982A20|nr:hypothetical protein [Nitriliruptor alkaliphilus]
MTVPASCSLASRTVAASAAALLTVGLVVLVVPSSAAQQDDRLTVLLDRETINARLAPDGTPDEVRLYTHLTVDGHGSHVIEDPAATTGLRSLSSLRDAPEADEDGVRWEVDLRGPRELRSVADHEGPLPVEIEVDLSLDGEPISAEEVVGRDGRLEVTYRLRNVSHRTVELRYPGADGEEVVEEGQVPLPLVGTVQTTLGSDRFDGIDPHAAIVAGDGRGGTQLQWSTALFAPLGDEVTELTYAADVRDAQLPPVRVSLVPAGSHQSPLDTGMASYEQIVGSLGEVEDGAGRLDDGARELAAGAAELMAGLTRIADGSRELAAGLTEARDGSGELSDGLGQARSGTGELVDGLGQARSGGSQLRHGAVQLDDGANEAADGGRLILDGLGQVEAGLEQLTAPDGVPAAIGGLDALLAGVRELRAGVGAADEDGTLRWGIGQVDGGIGQLRDVTGILLRGGVLPTGDEYPGLPFIADGAQELGDGLCEFADGPLGLLLPQLREACDGARLLEEGIRGTEQIVDGVDGGLAELADGVAQLRDGLDEVAEGIDRDAPGDPGLLAGLGELREGLAAAEDGLGQLLEGARELADGQGQLVDGLGELSTGTGQLRAGATELRGGLGQLEDGGQELRGGLAQLDDGGRELAAGLVEAQAGSAELGDGAELAADGSQQLADGAGRLIEEGTEVLHREVAEGRTEQSRTLAFFRAVDERGRTDGMPYGAAHGAPGEAAYVFDLVGTQTTQAPGIATVGVVGLLAFALAGAIALGLARRGGPDPAG